MSKEMIPLVSVIIPMYNAAKFIPQTLESLLHQTMQDFEVIVIDDCSTDNSVEIVEGFAEKFGGRLHVIKLPENTGEPSFPRNVGIQYSHGKYIAFLDNDDFFTKTALEELSTLAEQYQADVVNMPECFFVEDKGEDIKELLNPSNYKVRNCQGANPIRLEKVAEMSNNIAERVNFWLSNRFHWSTWATFCKRDFLIENQISFPKMPVSDDQIFNFLCLCFGKKVISVPNITYIYREHSESISHETVNAEKFFHRWLRNLIQGFKAFDKAMNRIPFFKQYPNYRYAILNWFFNRGTYDAKYFPSFYAKIPLVALNPFVEKEFHSDDAVFSSYLFNIVNIYKLQIATLRIENYKLRRLQEQAISRSD